MSCIHNLVSHKGTGTLCNVSVSITCNYLARLAGVTALLLICTVNAVGQKQQSLQAELQRLGTNTALVLPSQAVDEHPLWSPDARYLAVNIAGKWLKIDLSTIELVGATWRRNLVIGVIQSKSSVQPATREEAAEWNQSTRWSPRLISTSSGTNIQLRQVGLGTSFVLTKTGLQPRILWSTDLENCHSLALSPDEHFVAFVSEQNGAVVMKLDQ